LAGVGSGCQLKSGALPGAADATAVFFDPADISSVKSVCW